MFPGGQNHPCSRITGGEGSWFRLKKELERRKPDRLLHGNQLTESERVSVPEQQGKNIGSVLCLSVCFSTNYETFDLVAQLVKNLLAMQETQVR